MKEEKPSAALAAVTCDEKSPEATAGLALPTAQENDEPWQTVNSKKKQGRKRKKGKGKEQKDGLATQTTSIPIAGASNMEGARKSGFERSNRESKWLNAKDLQDPACPQQRTVESANATPDKVKHKHPSEEVTGVRRVWGTMRGCSCRTVLTVLQRLTTVVESVEVRRKFKKKDNNRVQWWFLIRAEEAVLQLLEQEWGAVETQTSWKLERCHKPAAEPTVTSVINTPNVSPFLLTK